MEKRSMRLRQLSIVACSEDDCSTLFIGKATAMSTIARKRLQMYILRSWLKSFTPPTPEPHTKYAEPILTTYPSTPLQTIVPRRHSLEGGWCKGTIHFQLRLRTYYSDHGCATPTLLTQLRLHLQIASSSPASLHLLSLCYGSIEYCMYEYSNESKLVFCKILTNLRVMSYFLRALILLYLNE